MKRTCNFFTITLVAASLLLVAACTTDGSSSSSSTSTRPAGESADGTTTDVTVTPPDGESTTPEIQSGTLTAADYDDQLNSDLYQGYVSQYLQTVGESDQAPYVDLGQRIKINVTDSSGTPYLGANILLRDPLSEQGNDLLQLKTPATGTSTIYPGFDALPETFALEVSDRRGDVVNTQSVTQAELEESREINVTLDSANQSASEVDLLLVIDTTGSMGDELNYLKAELTTILSRIKNNNPQVSLRTGLIVYRDIGDDYVVNSFQFTDDISVMQSSLNAQSFDGGGDYPEAMDQAMAEALTLDWRTQSSKILLLVADAPPHQNRISATWQSALSARTQQIHIVPVAASGVASEAEFLMRAMAALTHSRYVFLTDDSGVGNAHEEPDVDCYIVTRLDNLLVRVVDSLLTGERKEPANEEIIRQVGNYSAGRCQSPSQ